MAKLMVKIKIVLFYIYYNFSINDEISFVMIFLQSSNVKIRNA